VALWAYSPKYLEETVWKIQMSPILEAQVSAKRGERPPYHRRITLPKTGHRIGAELDAVKFREFLF
jgi:hypothetical protein